MHQEVETEVYGEMEEDEEKKKLNVLLPMKFDIEKDFCYQCLNKASPSVKDTIKKDNSLFVFDEKLDERS